MFTFILFIIFLAACFGAGFGLTWLACVLHDRRKDRRVARMLLKDIPGLEV
jgi:hypothetical protein